jgi:hypothetical protein
MQERGSEGTEPEPEAEPEPTVVDGEQEPLRRRSMAEAPYPLHAPPVAASRPRVSFFRRTPVILLGLMVAFGLGAVIGADGPGQAPAVAVVATPVTGSSAPATTPATSAAPVLAASAPVVLVTTTPPAPPQAVTYSCTGHAYDGVDITYGPEGSSFSADRLPFSKILALDSNAQYFDTQAQLQGGGSVSCSTVVDYDDGLGDAQSASNSGSASGGYNIADAEVCSDYTGDWEAC